MCRVYAESVSRSLLLLFVIHSWLNVQRSVYSDAHSVDVDDPARITSDEFGLAGAELVWGYKATNFPGVGGL